MHLTSQPRFHCQKQRWRPTVKESRVFDRFQSCCSSKQSTFVKTFHSFQFENSVQNYIYCFLNFLANKYHGGTRAVTRSDSKHWNIIIDCSAFKRSTFTLGLRIKRIRSFDVIFILFTRLTNWIDRLINKRL